MHLFIHADRHHSPPHTLSLRIDKEVFDLAFFGEHVTYDEVQRILTNLWDATSSGGFPISPTSLEVMGPDSEHFIKRIHTTKRT